MLAPAAASTPRKAPRQRRSKATFEAILEATAHILETEGIDAANTNRIAERAGVSIGSLYQYFPGKTAIFAELIRAQDSGIAGSLAELVSLTRGMTLERRLGALAAAAVRQQFARPRLARLLDALEPTLGEDETLATADSAIQDLLLDLLGDHQTEIAAPVTRTLAQDLLAMSKGLIDAASFAGEDHLKGLEARVVGALLGYLQWKGPAPSARQDGRP